MKPIYLRTAREQRQWTQRRLADISRIPQNVISKLETQTPKRQTYQTVVRLAEALAIPLERLRLGPDPAQANEPQDGRQRVAVRRRRRTRESRVA
jgi:transcriptional regulator with XRE-family HTH domain